MIPLSRVDAAFKRVQEDSPDLDISLLSLDDADVAKGGREELHAQTSHIRSAMVARIADTVKQAPKDISALDSAVAMVEVLISTYSGNGERRSRGHKHVIQAIQLLASTKSRFDKAIDLYFDWVERFCAHVRSEGNVQSDKDAFTGAWAVRMMQNYDQTLVKLISKHWNAHGPNGNYDVGLPLERIKVLRYLYESSNESSSSAPSCFGICRKTSTLFCDSQQLLETIQKRRISELLVTKLSARQWPQYFVGLMSGASRADVLRIRKEVLVIQDGVPELSEIRQARRKIARRDSPKLDLK